MKSWAAADTETKIDHGEQITAAQGNLRGATSPQVPGVTASCLGSPDACWKRSRSEPQPPAGSLQHGKCVSVPRSPSPNLAPTGGLARLVFASCESSPPGELGTAWILKIQGRKALWLACLAPSYFLFLILHDLHLNSSELSPSFLSLTTNTTLTNTLFIPFSRYPNICPPWLLPQTRPSATSLASGSWYVWSLKITCDSRHSRRFPTASKN